MCNVMTAACVVRPVVRLLVTVAFGRGRQAACRGLGVLLLVYFARPRQLLERWVPPLRPWYTPSYSGNHRRVQCIVHYYARPVTLYQGMILGAPRSRART